MALKSVTFQIGKFGVTPGVIESLSLALKNHKQVRISVLKSSGRNRENIEEIAKELVSKLKENCTYTIVGFTIILARHGASPLKKAVK